MLPFECHTFLIGYYFLQVYAFEETEDGCEPKFKWYRKRRIADKMYEFCSDDDENMENICPRIKMRRYKILYIHLIKGVAKLKLGLLFICISYLIFIC